MSSPRKVILFIAMSLDGYIAKRNDDLSFLSLVEKQGEDYGYNDFIRTVDTVILGRKTYDKVLSMGYDFPHKDKESYIITRTPRPAIGNTRFHTGDVNDLVANLKCKEGKNIFIDGGAQVINELLKNNLVDEMYISIIPILLGDGISLFKNERPENRLELKEAKPYESGLVQLHYTIQF
ncbi:MAG: dihydrofolate reductase [Flavisolibacter sp.]|nr:dihydrofolate reductase [Flavisolibacter sp.]